MGRVLTGRRELAGRAIAVVDGTWRVAALVTATAKLQRVQLMGKRDPFYPILDPEDRRPKQILLY